MQQALSFTAYSSPERIINLQKKEAITVLKNKNVPFFVDIDLDILFYIPPPEFFGI